MPRSRLCPRLYLSFRLKLARLPLSRHISFRQGRAGTKPLRWFPQACRRLRFQLPGYCATTDKTTSRHRATTPTVTALLALHREARPSYRLAPHRPHWVCRCRD